MEINETQFEPISVYQGCPHFGLRNDPETKLLFASPRAGCHCAGPVQPVEISHQGHYCLTAAHTSCPMLTEKRLPKAAPVVMETRAVQRFLGWIRPFPTHR